MFDKPFADVRRARHDEVNRGRRLGQHGHTARKVSRPDVPSSKLERSDNILSVGDYTWLKNMISNTFQTFT